MSTLLNRPRALEREEEHAEIERALADAGAGGGRLLLIDGPSGIGKSLLLDEARTSAHDAGMDVLHARAGELEREHSFGVVLRLFEQHLASATDVQRTQLLRGRAKLAAPLLSAGEVEAEHAGASNELALIHGLYWCVVNLSEERPVALLVDDVHWADELSLRFLLYLADRLEDLSVALLVAVRTGDPHARAELVTQLRATGGAHRVRPTELSLDAIRTLLDEAELEAGDAFVDGAWQATRGNPFLVRELVAVLRAEDDAGLSTDPGRLASLASEAVGHRVMVRLARLGPEAVALARASAILGEEAPLRHAAQLAGLEIADAVIAAERLVAAQILAGTAPMSIAHPMIRSAIYAQLPPGERPRAHVAAGRLLHDEGGPAEEVARHLAAGTPPAEAWAWRALHDGARAAARKGAPRTAMRYLRLALDLCPSDERDPGMLIDMGLVEAATGEPASPERFEQALLTIEEPPDRARALYALGQTLFRYGRHAEAAAAFRRGAEMFADDPEIGRGFEGAFLCAAYYHVPLRREMAARLESVDAEKPATTAADRVRLAVLALERGMTTAPASLGAALAHRALADGALLAEQTSESIAVNLAICTLASCGRAQEAQRAVEDVLADARARGSATAFAEASLVRALVLHGRGLVADAAVDAQAAVDGMAHSWHAMGPMAPAILTHCLLDLGKREDAAAVLDRAQDSLLGLETRGSNAWFHCARGRYRLLTGDAEGALADFLEAGDILAAYGVRNPILGWRSQAAVAAHAAGHTRLARRLIDEEIASARAFELPASLGAALHARARTETDDAAADLLTQAAAILEGADAPLELARVLMHLGSLKRRAGERAASRRPLRRALELAHFCGATSLEEEVRGELRASGGRLRRIATSGAAALTPSERRIAQLAASGLTNRQVAERLFLTKNTVDWHLRRVFRKLEIASRDELGDRLANAH